MWLEDTGCAPEVIFHRPHADQEDFWLAALARPRPLHPGPLDRRPVDDQEHAAPAVAVEASHREEQRRLLPSPCVSSLTGQGARSQTAAEQLPVAVPVTAAGPHDEDREQEDPLLVTIGFITRDEWIQLKAQPLLRFRQTLLPRLSAECYLCRRVYGRAARVHRLGSCYRMPGIDYDNFEHVGEAPTQVEGAKFLFCKRRFCTGAPSTFGESSSSEGSSSNAQDVGRTSAGG